MDTTEKNSDISIVFIIGSGRSGTTILYNLLSMHPDVCYFSALTNNHPNKPWFAVFHRVLDIPVIGHMIRGKITSSSLKNSWILPNEGENIYRNHCGFINMNRTTIQDFDTTTYRKFSESINVHAQATGRTIFITKQTSNIQRLELLHAMFPDAYWVHIIRDGRAVANSLFHIDWWNSVTLWWTKKQPNKMHDVALCGKHWKTNVLEILNHKQLLGSRYVEIRYESLIRNPRAALTKILRRIHLPVYKKFMSFIPKSLPDKNKKWQKQLTPSQQKNLKKEIQPLLSQLGYKP